ncbi:FkbM family methyltransferase [Okeania sp. SIO1F9]|uniref:FkbM family methyltransferase n=1 Tax=Okeania sp. SIO1F9 TaxID=2607813 RepID=UPI00144D6615|nr:FkbM family methyltransferase [Okeania sp. SIO1F9]NET76666.1 FkbM family methyltransferase [Okeania sp. SIO1F9]
MGNEGMSAGQLLKQANQLKRAGRLDEAIAIYHQAIEINPNFAWAYNNLGDAFVKQDKLDEAVVEYQKAIEINPNSALYYYNLGEVLAQQGKLNKAVDNFTKAVEIQPYFYKFQSNLGQAFHRKNLLDSAISCYRKVLAIKPYSGMDCYNLAEVLYKKQEWEEAVTFYKRAAKISPQKFKKSFGLNGLDLKLADYLNFDNGFFIEAGANNGISQSNTVFLERYRNWTGVLIEPIPDLVKLCRHNRPRCVVENYALVPFNYDRDEIDMHYCNLMSLVKQAMSEEEVKKHIKRGCELQKIETYVVKVPVTTLNFILEKHKVKRIDLLSLDVEGFELQVLQGLNFNQFRPRFMLIEVRQGQRQKMDSFCNSVSYRAVAEFSQRNYYQDVLYES